MAKKNKKLFYKIGLPIASIGTIVAPLATLVACEDTGVSTDNWKFNSHRIVQYVTKSASGISYLEESGILFFNTPLTNSSSDVTETAAAQTSTALTLFRYVQPSFDEMNFDNTTGKVIGVTPKRDSKKRFEMASEVILHVGNNSEHFAYDTDEDPDPAAKKYSINGKHIEDVLEAGGITGFEFKMRSDLSEHHWVRQLSGEKGAKISPKDLIRGIQIQIMGSGKTRSSLTTLPFLDEDKASIKTTDDKINAAMLTKYKGYKNPAVTGDATSSQGIFYDSNYGLQGKQILEALNDENTLKNFVPDENTFQLPIDSNVKLNGIASKSLWNSLFGKSSYFAAVSDEEIKKLIATKDDELKSIIGEEAFNKIKDTEIYKSGYYQRIISPRTGQFVAGQYYFSESTSKLTVLKQNEDYVDERWLNQVNSKNQKTTVQEFRIKTIMTSDISKTTIANEYAAGTNAWTLFDNFNATRQIEMLQDMRKWGVNFTTPFTPSKISGGMSYFSLNPIIDGNGRIYYSNNFAKLFYGDTIHNIEQSGSLDEMIKYQTTGNGLQFRTNLAAIVNSTGFAKLASSTGVSTNVAWFTPYAPEGTIGKVNGKDVFLSNVMLEENGITNNGVDEEKVVNPNVVNIEIDPTTGETTKINTVQIPYTSYIEQVSKTDFSIVGPSTEPSDALEKKQDGTHYSPFEWIQKNINESINRMLKTNYPVGHYSSPSDVPEAEKITFEIPWSNAAFTQTQQFVEAYKAFKKVLQSIDPRLNPVAAVTPAREDSTNDAVVKTEDVSTTFYLSKPANSSNPYEDWRYRYRTMGVGYGVSPLWLGGDSYSEDTPASVFFYNMGYLQTGLLFQLSYLASQSDFTSNSSKYGVLSQTEPIVKFLNDRFTETQGTSQNHDGFWDPAFESRFTSSFKQDILDALRSYKFIDLYKSEPNDVAKYDYIGMKGLEKIKELKDMLDFKNLSTEDAKKTEDELTKNNDTKTLDLFNRGRSMSDDDANKLLDDIDIAADSSALFFKNAAAAFEIEVFAQNDVQYKLDVMQGFEVLNYQQFQPYNTLIADRRFLAPTLRKPWLSLSAVDLGANVSVGRWRVDMDHEDNDYLKPVVINTKDEFGNTIVY